VQRERKETEKKEKTRSDSLENSVRGRKKKREERRRKQS
jgi:hypothetical protein